MTQIVLLVTLLALYVVVLRLLDGAGREPLSLVFLHFALGLVAGVLLVLLVPSPTLYFEVLLGATLEEGTRFAAIAIGIWIVWRCARDRASSEFDSPTDGIVYGASAGLGLYVGKLIVEEIRFWGVPSLLVDPSLVSRVLGEALAGMSEGLTGALIGVSMYFCVFASSRPRKALFLVAGFLAAIAINAAHGLATDVGLFGTIVSRLAALTGLGLPVLVFLLGSWHSARRARRILSTELSPEKEDSRIIDDEDRLLHQSALRREWSYMRALLRGQFRHAAALRNLHTRQVRLAFAKDRAADETPPPARDLGLEAGVPRQKATREVEELRTAVRAAREKLPSRG